MKILSIDTASNVCGVSILDNENLICKMDSNTGRTHSENLLPMIRSALTKSSIKLNNIDLIVCDKGPGSFTGIRIGIATIKAFSDSLNINCLGISSLESLAYNLKEKVKENELICSLIDCKNDNCYYALYEFKNNSFNELIMPSTNNINNILDLLSSYLNSYNSSILFIGDGAVNYKELICNITNSYNFANDDDNILNSFSLGLAGLAKFNKGTTNENVLPVYLKKPQAQIQLENKLKNERLLNDE